MSVVLADAGLGWSEPLSEPVSLVLEVAPLMVLALAYRRRARTLSRRGRPVPLARRLSFGAGLALMLLAVASPIAHVADAGIARAKTRERFKAVGPNGHADAPAKSRGQARRVANGGVEPSAHILRGFEFPAESDVRRGVYEHSERVVQRLLGIERDPMPVVCRSPARR